MAPLFPLIIGQGKFCSIGLDKSKLGNKKGQEICKGSEPTSLQLQDLIQALAQVPTH